MTDINSPFGKLINASPDAELWWDSSPLVYSVWLENFLNTAPTSKKRLLWKAQLNNFFNPENPSASLVRGITTNPSLISQWIRSDPDTWNAVISQKMELQINPKVETTYKLIYNEAISRSAAKMKPLWVESGGRFGWVSGQTDPRLMFDEEGMFTQGTILAKLGANVMVKIPGTQQGYKVIRRLTALGISTNSTLSFTLPQFVACTKAVEAGLSDAYSQNIDVSRWRSVITHMIGRFGSMGDLNEEAKARNINLSPYMLRIAEIEILKKAHTYLKSGNFSSTMLLSSLLTNDDVSGAAGLSMHLENTTGGKFAYTCKPGFVANCITNQSKLSNFRENTIDEVTSDEIMENLLRLPSFRNAYDPEGIPPLEFASTAPFLGTYKEVNDNIRRLIDFVGRSMELQTRSIRITGMEAA